MVLELTDEEVKFLQYYINGEKKWLYYQNIRENIPIFQERYDLASSIIDKIKISRINSGSLEHPLVTKLKV